MDIPKLLKHLDNIHIEFQLEEDDQRCFLNGIDIENQIRTMDVSNHVSQVSAFSQVRSYLVSLQRSMGHNKGMVMEGRDIGTVVFPQAACKFYLTATPDIRAKRRFQELMRLGKRTDYETVLKNVVQRDEIDQNRKHSPLLKAKDAIEIEVSYLTAEEVFLSAKKILTRLLNNRGRDGTDGGRRPLLRRSLY